jgi:hypothetical protein
VIALKDITLFSDTILHDSSDLTAFRCTLRDIHLASVTAIGVWMNHRLAIDRRHAHLRVRTACLTVF